MKFLLLPFAGRDTDSISNSFNQARLKLVLLYLVIIAIVISVFAYLVVLQVNQKIDSQQLRPNSQIVINANEALAKAQLLKPGGRIETTVYSLEDNTLLYKIQYRDGSDIEVDMLTGSAQIGDKSEHITTILELLTDNIAKIIGWIGGIIFLLASIGSLIIAQATLKPIAVSTKKQKRFVSDAAHELRNPLASLQMTLESYLRSPKKTLEFTDSVAKDMLHEVKRLIVTSESLLKLEAIESRQKNILPNDFRNVLSDVEKQLSFDLQTKNINVVANISDNLINIDRNDLTTILYNLLHNAIKFSEPKSQILVSWNGNKIQIIDHGLGIDDKHLPYIFERFYKTDPARSSGINSNGLGLALVSDIIQSYSAKISVESKLNQGTTFTIIF
jgi:signal transduction histidine kinase